MKLSILSFRPLPSGTSDGVRSTVAFENARQIQICEAISVGFRSCFGDFAHDIVRAFVGLSVFLNVFAHLRLVS